MCKYKQTCNKHNVQPFVSQEEIEIAKFLGIGNSETVFIVRKVAKIYEWEQHQNIAEKEEPKQSTLLPELAKCKLGESFSRKLALTILKTGTLDYSNCELMDIINSFIETFVQENTVDTQLKVKERELSSTTTESLKEIKEKGKEKDKELEEKIVKIEQSVKSEQGIELPISQEESLISKESNMIKDKEVLQESDKAALSKAFYFNTKLYWELEPVFETIQEMVDNGNKNLQKDTSGRFKCEPMKEQDRETAKARSKVIKIFKENPYMNNGSASIILKEKTQEFDIDKIKNLLLNITSRLNSIERSQIVMNRKRLLQKELTLKIGCHNINRLKTNQQKFETLGQWLDDEAFDIFAVTDFVEKKIENFKFFRSDTTIDKRKGL
ncbi:17542_t:CDS:2, partial [Gigaspora margarita]